ncbi:hypothetical protein ACQKNC_10085 [Lysinibacillus sp. NPDC094177]|uniref:hypothetical protein n=1 Tax=Lysinibacillus sp. NPDC094177 TaxID=3390580 RepID=UPI003D052890
MKKLRKNFLSLIMALTLVLSINTFFLAKAKADTLSYEQYQVTVDNQMYDLKIHLQDNLKTVTVDDGNTVETVVYNMENNKVYVDGEEISNTLVTFFEEIVEDEKSFSLSPPDNLPLNRAADQSAGWSNSWIYEYSNKGSINLSNLTTSVIVGVLAAIFTKNVIVGGLAAIATAIAGSISSEKSTVYYEELRYWKPDVNWPEFYKDYKSVITFYKYSRYTGKITTKTIYH